MKIKSLLIVLVLLAGFFIVLVALWFINEQLPALTPEEKEAERIVLAYIEAKNLNIKPGTYEYGYFMKDILLGGHPELTRYNSTFVSSDQMRDAIISYACKRIDKKYRQQSPEFTVPQLMPTIPIQPTIDCGC